MESDDDFDEESFLQKTDKMEQLFPNLKFIPYHKHFDILDNVLVKNKDAIIYYKHNDYYYSNYPTTPKEIIYIKRNRFITYRDFYEECSTHWQHDCGDHRFLEFIEVTNDTQIDMFFGS